MEYADTLAGLAQAISDAGVDPESLGCLESINVCDISAAVQALQRGQLPPEQSACVQAILRFAWGPSRSHVLKQKGQSCHPLRFGGATCLSRGPGSLAKRCSQPGARESMLASFRRDVWAPSNHSKN